MASIDLNKCEVKIKAKPDFENPKVVTRITVKATHTEHGTIANLSAYKIKREYCRGQFLEVMDEYSDELHQFSIELFDKNGLVRPWLVDGSRRSGTGCWNRDLDYGNLIYLMDMSVKDQVRKQIHLFELGLNKCFYSSDTKGLVRGCWENSSNQNMSTRPTPSFAGLLQLGPYDMTRSDGMLFSRNKSHFSGRSVFEFSV
jgi:hypothetical protein